MTSELTELDLQRRDYSSGVHVKSAPITWIALNSNKLFYSHIHQKEIQLFRQFTQFRKNILMSNQQTENMFLKENAEICKYKL